MKTLPVLTSLAALVAFALLPFSPVVAISSLFLVAVAPIILADYSSARPLTTSVTTVTAGPRRSERLGLAA